MPPPPRTPRPRLRAFQPVPVRARRFTLSAYPAGGDFRERWPTGPRNIRQAGRKNILFFRERDSVALGPANPQKS